LPRTSHQIKHNDRIDNQTDEIHQTDQTDRRKLYKNI